MADPLGTVNNVLNGILPGGARVDLRRGTVSADGVGTVNVAPQGSRVLGLFRSEAEQQRTNPNDTLSVNELNVILGVARTERPQIMTSQLTGGAVMIWVNGESVGTPLRFSPEALQMVAPTEQALTAVRATPAAAANAAAATNAPTAAPAAAAATTDQGHSPEVRANMDRVVEAARASAATNQGQSAEVRANMDRVVEAARAGATIPPRPAAERESNAEMAAAAGDTSTPPRITDSPAPITVDQPLVAGTTAQPVLNPGLQPVTAEAPATTPAPAPTSPAYSREQIGAISGKLSQEALKNATPEQIAAIEAFIAGSSSLKADGKISENEVTAALNRMQHHNWGTAEERAQIATLGAALGVQGVAAPVTATAAPEGPRSVPFAPELEGAPGRNV